MSSKRRIFVTAGQRFGHGVVTDPEIELSPTRGQTSPMRGARLLCDCGNVYERRLHSLLRGDVKSCGCATSDLKRATFAKNSKRKVSVTEGQRFGRLTVLSGDPVRLPGTRAQAVEVRCDCGTVKTVRTRNLVRSESCGCGQREAARDLARQRNTTHGMARRDNTGRYQLYQTWQGMLARCHDPRDKSYELYGARGTTVWPAWRSAPTAFIEWVEANLGTRPDGMTLDRWPDNAGNYEPGNLRWATVTEQNNNRRPRRWGRKPGA